MAGQTVILTGPSQRRFAQGLIDRTPSGAVLNIREAKRTADQNAKMWAMLSDISRASPEGRLWTTDTWKADFMHALGHEIQWQPGLNGESFPAGLRTSRLNKTQMAELITLIQEYGDATVSDGQTQRPPHEHPEPAATWPKRAARQT